MSGGRRTRRRRRPDNNPRLLHHLAPLLSLGQRSEVGPPRSVADRRHRQHLALARRLLDPLPTALRSADGGARWFWRALRWGGPGLLIGWWLGR